MGRAKRAREAGSRGGPGTDTASHSEWRTSSGSRPDLPGLLQVPDTVSEPAELGGVHARVFEKCRNPFFASDLRRPPG